MKLEPKALKWAIGTEVEFLCSNGMKKESLTPLIKGAILIFFPSIMKSNCGEIWLLLWKELNFNIEASHHEVAPGQHEIDFQYGNALKIADNLITLKLGIKTLAIQNGYVATFMPKPVYSVPGSGMHTHLSLFKDGKNAFMMLIHLMV